ncbi:type II secretion system protein M [Desulfospira joergensenii]|uniref:type II secretion system protein M n=1 Tax=Desulfospira joergensenii TaxID=53329 RepID=UPI0003FEF100|nr:type II secretion system protein M [Desulfospira joergensenii]
MPDLSRREIVIVSFGIAFAVLFFGFQLGVAPVLENRENLGRILAQKRIALEEMVQLRRQFQSLSGTLDHRADDLARRKKGFSLFSFLDAQAEQSGVKTNVVNMKPFTRKLEKSSHSLATVKIKLKEVFLKDLVDFLLRIESSGNSVDITSLSLTKAGKEERKLDAVIETQTLMLEDKS